MSEITPAEALRLYQQKSPPDLTLEVERMVGLGTKDILRLLSYMVMHASIAVRLVSSDTGTERIVDVESAPKRRLG